MSAPKVGAVPTIAWTPENRAVVARMTLEGATGLQVANLFGTTRSAVLGLINRRRRLGDPTFDFETPPRPRMSRPLEFTPSAAAPAPAPASPKPKPAPPTATPRPRPMEACRRSLRTPPTDPVTIWELTTSTCRYPVDDGLYCGAAADRRPRCPYCRRHARMAYSRSQGARQ